MLALLCGQMLCSCAARREASTLTIAQSNPSTADWAYTQVYHDRRDTLSFRPKAVFYGDSITQGWVDEPFFASHSSIPMGIGGMTTAQLLCRFRTDVLNIAPEKVVIMCGTNDIAQNIGPVEYEVAVGNIASMCDLARYNGIEPLVCSVTPCSGYSWMPDFEDPAGKVVAFNDILKKYCEESGVKFVDYHSALADEDGGIKAEYTRDGCHLTSAGYKVLESIIGRYL